MPTQEIAVEERIITRCTYCQLNQFVTRDGKCRKCHATLVIPTPQPEAVETEDVGSQTSDNGLTLMRILGQKNKAARESRQMSQQYQADKAGCPRSFISKIENAKSGSLVETVCRLAGALNIEPADLMPTLDEWNGIRKRRDT